MVRDESSRLGRLLASARPVAVPLVLLAGLVALALVSQAQDPVGRWLLWAYLPLVLLAAVWAASCLSIGFLLLSRLGGETLPARERLVQSFALGLMVFVLALVAVGLLPGGLGPATFVGLPLALALLGARPLVRFLRRFGRRLARARARAAPPGGLAWLATVFGLLGAAAVYANILTPFNVAYDAQWYHLPIAEHYAAAGRITRFDEGWFLGTLPHLASHVYTWAFMLPAGGLFHRIELAAHLEYVLFLATLAALPVLVHQLVPRPRPRPRASWAALFLFPGILLYDSSLSVAADHVLAFWAIPIFLAFRRFWRGGQARDALLLGAALGGAASTKYQALYLLAFPVLALLVRALLELVRRRPGRGPEAARPPALSPRVPVVAATALVASAPHWLLNLIWHHNPVYPYLITAIGGTPWAAGAFVGLADPGWTPEGTFVQRLGSTLSALATFAFDPHDWATFHGERPVFGALFTICLAALPFLRPAGRIVPLAAASLLGVGLWYWTYHQDRYLQGLLPWLAAVTAAALVLAWRTGWASRAAATALVLFQIVSCADIYFLPTHGMSNEAPVARVVRMLSTGHQGTIEERYRTNTAFANIASVLPADAKVLVHEIHRRLGLGRQGLSDGKGRQGAIDYPSLGGPAEVEQAVRRLGVTHVAWPPQPQGFQPLLDDVVFHDWVRTLADPVAVDGFLLAPLGERPASGPPPIRQVAILGCTAELTDLAGLGDRLNALREERCSQPASHPPDLAQAELVVVNRRIVTRPPELGPRFTLLFSRDGLDLYRRPR